MPLRVLIYPTIMTILMCKNRVTFEDFQSQLMIYKRRLRIKICTNDAYNQIYTNVARFGSKYNNHGSKNTI